MQEPHVQLYNTKKDDCEEKEQYNGPWYNRTEDWISEHIFGQKIKKIIRAYASYESRQASF